MRAYRRTQGTVPGQRPHPDPHREHLPWRAPQPVPRRRSRHRSHHRALRAHAAALLALALLAGLQLGTASPAPAAPSAPAPAPRVAPAGPLFNQPTGTGSQQRAIRSDILARILAAAPKSTIKVAVYHFWDAEIARALASAHADPARKVNVQVMLDESSKTAMPSSTSYAIMRDALGTDRTKPSFVGLCPKDRSCLGDPGEGASIGHNKFWLFSDSGGAKNVVLQTSSNMTTGSYTKFWNDSMVVQQAGTYAAYSTYFGKIAGRDWAAWKYRRSDSPPYTAYFFPRPGAGNGTDTVHNILDNVTCRWTDSAGSHRTNVRLAMFKLTRQGIADKLADLQRDGCAVDIVYAETDSKASSGSPGTWEALHFSGGPQMRCLHYDDDGDPDTSQQVVHAKTLLISGRYAGATDQVVWTGSHNYSGPALRKNDETLLKIDDTAVHHTYLEFFQQVKAAAVPGVNDDTGRCKGVLPQPER